MSIKEIGENASNRIDIENVPSTINPIETVGEWKEDKDKTKCLYITHTILVEDIEVKFTEKFRPFHLQELKSAMEKIGIEEIDEAREWTVTKFSSGFNRHIPVK